MEREKISKSKYVTIVWITLFLGIIGNLIFSTIGIFRGFNYYVAAYMAVSTLVIGFALGMAYARSWKIEGIDK